LAQAFFTVMEARKACNQGHVAPPQRLPITQQDKNEPPT
jgi:hypothetical protein